MVRNFSIAALLLICAAATGTSHAQSVSLQPSATTKVPGDRWMEIDLYWFDHDDIQNSVDAFWDRFTPLYQNVAGDRGAILNIGWTVGFIMDWSGRPGQLIPLPQGKGEQPWVSETSALEGDTTARMQEWKDRFAKPIMVQKQGYGSWTYAELRELSDRLRESAAKRGIPNFKVGALVYAWDNAYGEPAPWILKHPEAMSSTAPHIPGRTYVFAKRFFDPGNRLHADSEHYAAYPNGFPEGTSVHAAFARQWGSLSRAANLDALMLRDSFGMMVPYSRRGRFGELMPTPQLIRKQTNDAAALVRETKQANPRVTLMMYSNAASAIGDWRANGCDLERIAKDGFLDVFVDQTWAGAWNEVGTRHNHFWNEPTLGWTYQLQYMLLHGAQLATTRVKHFPLIETFDAWESWDTLHTVPERLRWSIWAYSHAGIKTPTGLRMPEGSYISWAHQGKRLLSPEDVLWLDKNISDAVRDAFQTKEIFGPTLVYSRSANQWLGDHATPTLDDKGWIDEQAGSIDKWPIPIQSATRIEWLSRIHTDLPLVETPSHLRPEEQTALRRIIDLNRPVALFGSFDNGISSEFLKLANIEASGSLESEFSLHTANNTSKDEVFKKNFPKQFPVQVAVDRTLPDAGELMKDGDDVLYSIDDSAQLLFAARHKNLLLWDPADFRVGMDKSLKQVWGGSDVAYCMAAAALNEQLRSVDALHALKIDCGQTTTVSAWKTRDHVMHVLLGNLEEGLRDDADRTRHVVLHSPESWPVAWRSVWDNQSIEAFGHDIHVEQKPEGSQLLEAK